MDGVEGAVQSRLVAVFLDLSCGFVTALPPHLLWMGSDNQTLAARAMMARADLSGGSTLLQELLHHPKGNPVALRNFLSSALFLIVGSQNPFA